MPGKRLKEERVRLGCSQEGFAALAGITRRPYAEWEAGNTSPTAVQLAAFAAAGVDVLYVVTGQRSSSMPAQDAAEQVLLESYRRCSSRAKQNLIQTAALLAADIDSASTLGGQKVSAVTVSSTYGHAAGRDLKMNSESADGKQRDLKPKRARGRA